MGSSSLSPSLFLLIVATWTTSSLPSTDSRSPNPIRVAVIGSGVSGLTSIHQVIKGIPDAEVVCFETAKDIGGTWVYTDRTGNDELGLPLTTSMYKNLKTNLPKEVMAYAEYPIPKEYNSFMTRTQFYNYLQAYAKEFELKKFIKFRHMVVDVKWNGINWDVMYKNLLTGDIKTETFDYVFVANGHYSKQFVPTYPGREIFKGNQTHSGNYRIPDPYKDLKVLVIGSGPSGLDISIEVGAVAKRVILSHHAPVAFKTPFPPHYSQKPPVRNFSRDSVTFVDGTEEKIDAVIYCTGYGYEFPFLDPSCDIKAERVHVYPLYRQVVNIEHPSMFFIGIPQLCCAVPLSEVQAKYAVAIIRGDFQLPSRVKMLRHMRHEYESKDKSGYPLARIATHMLGGHEPSYYWGIEAESGVKKLPPVLSAIRYSTMNARRVNLYTYRQHDFRIVDDYHFVRSYRNRDGQVVSSSGKCKLMDYHGREPNATVSEDAFDNSLEVEIAAVSDPSTVVVCELD